MGLGFMLKPIFIRGSYSMELNSKNIKKILLIILAGALIFTLVQNFQGVLSFFSFILSVLSPVITALCIAFVLNILLSALENKVFGFMDKSKRKLIQKFKRPICLILTYLIAFGIISVLILVIIPNIVDTLIYLTEKMPRIITDAIDNFENFLISFNIDPKNIPEIKINWVAAANAVKDWLSGSTTKIFNNAINITTSLFSGIFNTIFSLFISVYVLAQKEKIGAFVKRFINSFIPTRASKLIYHISEKTYDSFAKFIGGQLIEAIILGALCFIGMTIFRFPNALIISVLICCTALVPIIGATIGTIIGFLLIVITSPIKALLFVVFLLVLQQIEGNVIYPKVVGKAVGLPGVIVVSAVLVGGNIGGITGTFISVPICAVIYTLLREAMDYCQAKKSAETNLEETENTPSCETE